MQNKENNPIDARTLPEIWATESLVKQAELRDAVVERLHITRQTFYYWTKGKTVPQYDEIRKRVCDMVNRTFGVHTYWRTLFNY